MATAPDIGRGDRDTAATTTNELYKRYGGPIFGYCLSQLRSREEAEDAVQQTFLNALRGLQRGTETHAEQAWLFKIAHNVCSARRMSSGRRLRLEAPNDFEILQEIIPSPTRGDALELIGIEEALEAMPENQRRAILLREWQGLSYREIGTELGLSQSSVEMLIFRARRTLAAALEKPEAPKSQLARLRNAVGIGPLVAALKSFLAGGAAVKTVVATVAVGTVGVTATELERHGLPAMRPQAAAAAAAPARIPAAALTSASIVTASAVRQARGAAAAEPVFAALHGGAVQPGAAVFAPTRATVAPEAPAQAVPTVDAPPPLAGHDRQNAAEDNGNAQGHDRTTPTAAGSSNDSNEGDHTKTTPSGGGSSDKGGNDDGNRQEVAKTSSPESGTPRSGTPGSGKTDKSDDDKRQEHARTTSTSDHESDSGDGNHQEILSATAAVPAQQVPAQQVPAQQVPAQQVRDAPAEHKGDATRDAASGSGRGSDGDHTSKGKGKGGGGGGDKSGDDGDNQG